MESWKSIPGFALYEVSDMGRVRRFLAESVMKQYSSPGGYKYIGLVGDEGKTHTKLVHRHVAQAFLPNPQEKKTVDHINHDPSDNRLSNLRWATMAEQGQHRRVKGRKLQGARAIRQLRADGTLVAEYASLHLAAVALGKGRGSALSRVARGLAKSAYGYGWAFVEAPIIEGEVWKAIDPRFIHGRRGWTVSSHGRMRNKCGQVTVGTKGAFGYLQASLQQRAYSVHRLVAQAFLPNPDTKPFVNHKDRNRSNPHVDNLEWTTASENVLHWAKQRWPRLDPSAVTSNSLPPAPVTPPTPGATGS